MAHGNILVVEDDRDIRELLSYNLTREGYKVATASCGSDAFCMVGEHTPDLIILDLTLPDMDGLEICARLRRESPTETVPVLILTARGGDDAVVDGLECGADDYLAKPFKIAELVARIKALLRARPDDTGGEPSVVSFEGLSLNTATYEASYDGRPVELTNREFKLLLHLVRRPGWTFTRKQIVDLLNENGTGTTERSVDVLIAGVRKKLHGGGRLIETARGEGYKLKD